MHIAFFGTPELCIPILESLSEAGYTPSLIVTNPDRPIGRKQIMTPTPVKVWGEEHNIPVLSPEKLRDEFREAFTKHTIDLSIVVAYGKIMPEWLIHLPKHGTINIHYSLLPKYRGASPVEAALLHGDTKTGVCIQKMAYELDSGDIIAEQEVPIEPNDTTPVLRDKLNMIAADMLVAVLPQYIAGKLQPVAQDHSQATFCHKIAKSDGEVNFTTMSDQDIWNRYRAYYPWPGIFCFDETGKRIKITEAAMKDGEFIMKKIIPEGKSEITLA